MSSLDPTLDRVALREAAAAVPGVPAGGPAFREPWEAQAFAMTLVLHQRGLFIWSEWTGMLAGEIGRAQAAGDPDIGETYYRHWLAALERMLVEKGVVAAPTLARYREAWRRAADRTPDGAPIVLRSEELDH